MALSSDRTKMEGMKRLLNEELASIPDVIVAAIHLPEEPRDMVLIHVRAAYGGAIVIRRDSFSEDDPDYVTVSRLKTMATEIREAIWSHGM